MSSDTCRWIFVLGDKLPTIYDAATAIHSVSKRPKSSQGTKAIHAYAVSLHETWLKAFGKDHVLTLEGIKKRLNNIMQDYFNKVYSKVRAKPSSLRQLNKTWRFSNVPVKKHAAKSEKMTTNNDLLDIGRNIEALTGDEAAFYHDQKTNRVSRLSEEIDIEFEEEREKIEAAKQEERECQEQELSFINDEEFEESITTTNVRKSPEIRKVTVDQAVQVCIDQPPPEIRKKRNTTDEVKDAIATVSYRSGVSVAKARVAVNAVCEKMYGHLYLLEPAKKDSLDAPVKKKPRTADDYEDYKFVLPGTKAVNDFKHKKALQQEIDAATKLINKPATTKVTLHYDTTSRSRIDGEWPALILNFLDNDPEKCDMIRLRPLFFAHENRDQIVKLIVETFSRLATATQNILSPQEIWNRIDAIMTDAVTKNLKIEYEVANILNTDHIPFHLLCKSHTCEKLDEMNIRCLAEIESKCKLRDHIEAREPNLKSFLRQSKCIVADVVIPALLKLVSKGADGKSTSLAEEFDLILEEDNVYKTYSLYKERRFTKLGYSAGSLYDCIPQFIKLLERTNKNNLLTRACSLYLESDLILAEMRALANFCYHVTMPFLNCIEKSDQNALVTILPQLHDELRSGKLETDSLKPFHVPWKHVMMDKQKPSSELDKFIILKMCVKASEGIEIQCSREYWDENPDLRATAIHKLSSAERTNLPTENMSSERLLASFGRLAAQSAQHSNKFFKAKRIRDDLMLETVVSSSKIEKSKQIVYKALDEMELNWTTEQKAVHHRKVEECFQKSRRNNEMIDILLKRCKEYGGPFTSATEMKEAIKNIKTEKQQKKVLRQEIQYQKLTHKRDFMERPELYKINTMSYDDMLANLAIILCENDINGNEDNQDFMSEEEIIARLRDATEPAGGSENDELNNEGNENIESTPVDFQYMQPLAVWWDNKTNKRQWYIGFYLDSNVDGTLRVDHLERINLGCNETWKRPMKDDIQDVHPVQIILCEVKGDWIAWTKESVKYKLHNIDDIVNAFFINGNDLFVC